MSTSCRAPMSLTPLTLISLTLSSLMLALVGACADPPAAGPEQPGPSTAVTPTLSEPTAGASGIPSNPSDPMPSDIVAGRITMVGSGPCYTVETDDGAKYALIGWSGATLAVGTVVRATITARTPTALTTTCPGSAVAVGKIEVVGR